MKRLILAAVAALIATGTAGADPVTHTVREFFTLRPYQPPATPQDYGGGRCGGAPDAGIWWGRFSGGNDVEKFTQLHTVEGCFASRASCQAWLQDLKTEFSIVPVYNHCTQGYRTGGNLPPWWSRRSD